MQPGSRRRLDRVLIGAGALGAGAVTALGAVAGNAENIERIWTLAEIREGQPARITEVIDYDFGSSTGKHGIYRTVPGLSPESAVEVTADAPDAFVLLPTSNGTRIRIGDPNETVSGRHRYRLGFELATITTPSGALGWDAVGTEWEVEIDEAEIHAVAPWRWTEISCDQGAAGAVGGCQAEQPEPGHLVVTVTDVEPGEGVSLYAAPGDRLERAPQLPEAGDRPSPPDTAGIAVPAGAAAAAAAGGGALASAMVRRAGRERVGPGGPADVAFASGALDGDRRVDLSELGAMATVEFAPPPGVPPWQGGVVLAERVQHDHKVSWLIGAAIDGYLELEGEDRALTIRRASRTDGDTGRVLDEAFGERNEIDLDSYDRRFAEAWTDVGRRMADWRRTSGLWEGASDLRTIAARVLGVIAALLGLGIALVGGVLAAAGGPAWVVPVVIGGVIAGAGVATVVRGWELRVRTPAGSALWLRVESFRRFLAASEAHHADEAAARGVLREYTAWAVALGEIDRWARAVDAAVTIQDPQVRSFVHVAPMLVSATSSASQAPSSGGGGFSGGGGGVGGGGGGGGGGSW